MSRLLTDHIVNPANDRLKIEVTDEPGHGGACHEYRISRLDRNPFGYDDGAIEPMCFWISFQNGPINEFGVNGITHEALLAILADRLRGFQSGPFACPENAEALAHIEAAQNVLKSRTLARMARGVEGTNVK